MLNKKQSMPRKKSSDRKTPPQRFTLPNPRSAWGRHLYSLIDEEGKKLCKKPSRKKPGII